jgi:predicted nucleic acid-binding protein
MLHYLDTNTLIAMLEARSMLSPGQRRFLEGIEGGSTHAVSSELALAECLVKPFADKNASDLAAWTDFLVDRPELPLLEIDREVMIESARIRAGNRIGLPDAMHLAAAKLSGCAAFVSNDLRLQAACPISYLLWGDI